MVADRLSLSFSVVNRPFLSFYVLNTEWRAQLVTQEPELLAPSAEECEF